MYITYFIIRYRLVSIVSSYSDIDQSYLLTAIDVHLLRKAYLLTLCTERVLYDRVPRRLALTDPVYAYWHWTVDAKGVQKSNSLASDLISGIRKTGTEYHMSIPFGYYNFEGTVSPDFSSLSLTMSDPNNVSAPFSLSLQYNDVVR